MGSAKPVYSQRQSGLEVVGSFTYLHEADLARALLESEGVAAWMLDEHQVRMRWHLAGALGGVKVAVAPADAERARELIRTDHSASLEEIPEQQLPADSEELCPRCGEAASSEERAQQLPGPLQWLASLVFLLSLGLLVPRRRFITQRACASCGHTWSTRESG